MSRYDSGNIPQYTGPAVYQIRCRKTGYVYIGASLRTRTRLLSHVKHLRLGVHKCKALQYGWIALGEENFTFSIIEKHESEERLYAREVELQKLCEFPMFNHHKHRHRHAFTPERRHQISEHAKNLHRRGLIHTAETRAATSSRMKELHKEKRIPTEAFHKAASAQWSDPAFREMRSRSAKGQARANGKFGK